MDTEETFKKMPNLTKPKRVLTQQQKDIINAKERMKQKAQSLDTLAASIMQALCRNSQDEEAVRLQLRGPDEKDLGGRNRESVQREIRSLLRRNYGY
jgi:hypothetical protein